MPRENRLPSARTKSRKAGKAARQVDVQSSAASNVFPSLNSESDSEEGEFHDQDSAAVTSVEPIEIGFAPHEIRIVKENTPRKRQRVNDGIQDYVSEFDPRLNFKYYVVPKRLPGIKVPDWTTLKQYRKFAVGEKSDRITFTEGDIVYVEPDPQQVKCDREPPISCWVAKVLECRAVNSENVYLRVVYLYRPEDIECGRQAHHGEDEVFPTNEMCIIDAASVNGRVENLKHWDDTSDAIIRLGYSDLMWRQTYDVLGEQKELLPKLKEFCTRKGHCPGYANPSKTQVQCSNEECMKWMHAECIEEDAVDRAHSQWSEEAPNEEGDPNGGNGDKTDAAIDPESKALTPKKTPRSEVALFPEQLATSFSTPKLLSDAISHDVVLSDSSTSPRKFSAKLVGVPGSLPDEQFEVEITDLRPGMKKKSWRNAVECLFCGTVLE